MSRKRNPFEDDVPWEQNPANPKVQETLKTTFEVGLTGMEIQCIGSALEMLSDYTMHCMTTGHSPTGGEVDRADEMRAMLGAMRMANEINNRLIEVWRRSVNGQTVGLGDLPPDPFGPGAGPYL